MMGFRSIEEMIGRVDKLEINPDVLHYKSRGLDLSALLTPATSLNENHSGVTKSFEQVCVCVYCRMGYIRRCLVLLVYSSNLILIAVCEKEGLSTLYLLCMYWFVLSSSTTCCMYTYHVNIQAVVVVVDDDDCRNISRGHSPPKFLPVMMKRAHINRCVR